MGNILLEVKMCFIMLKYWDYSALYNATLHRLTCKMPLLQKVKSKENPQFFFSCEIFTVFREQIAIFYQIFKSGSSKKKKIKCPQFTKVICQGRLKFPACFHIPFSIPWSPPLPSPLPSPPTDITFILHNYTYLYVLSKINSTAHEKEQREH